MTQEGDLTAQVSTPQVRCGWKQEGNCTQQDDRRNDIGVQGLKCSNKLCRQLITQKAQAGQWELLIVPHGLWESCKLDAYSEDTLTWQTLCIQVEKATIYYFHSVSKESQSSTNCTWGKHPLQVPGPIPQHSALGLYIAESRAESSEE